MKRNCFTGMVLLFIIVALVGCSSTPKTPQTLVYYPPDGGYNTSITEDQMATLFVPPGNFEVYRFDGIDLNPKWFQLSTRSSGLSVKIPSGLVARHNAGDHTYCDSEIVFNYWDNTYGNAEGVRLAFCAIEGRNYKLYRIITGPRQMLFMLVETSETREPNSDEQVVLIKKDLGGGVLVFNKDTRTERKLYLENKTDLRIILPKGEHTISIESTSGDVNYFKPMGDPIHSFILSDNPVTLNVDLQFDRSNRSNWIPLYNIIME